MDNKKKFRLRTRSRNKKKLREFNINDENLF